LLQARFDFMTLAFITRIVAGVLRFLFGSALWCAWMQLSTATFSAAETAYVVPPTSAALNPIHSVAATDADTFVVTVAVPSSADHAFRRQIAKIGAAALEEPVRMRIPLTPRSGWVIQPLSDAFVVNGSAWWYATLDDRDGAIATTFLKSDGSSATYARPQPVSEQTNAASSNSWQLIAIPGEKPRMLELTYATETTIAREVDWSGASRSWQLPPVSFEHPGRMVAEPLPDGRIALLSNADGLSLYLLGDEGHVDSFPLRNLRVQQFDAALDDAGRLAIAAARNAVARSATDTGTIDVAIVDPAHPDAAVWSPLRHDVRVGADSHAVQLVATPDGFAVAWINEAGGTRVEAASIDRRGHGGAVVDVGSPSTRFIAPFLGMQARHEELLFWWEDGEHLVQRRLPASLTGYAFADELARRFCGATEAH